MLDRFMNGVESLGAKLQGNAVLAAIRNAFTDMIPLIIAGSFASLINNVICSTSNGLAQFSGFEFLAKGSPIFASINYATMNFLAIYLVFKIGAEMAKEYDTNATITGFTALACYLTLVPTNATATAEESQEAVRISNVISSGYTNSQGMFLAIIVGLLAGVVFSRLYKSGKFRITMPDSVPSNVSASFEVLFPVTITIFLFGIIGFCLYSLTGQYVPDLITKVLQAPMEAIMQHPAGVIALVAICQLFWMVGIHGSQMVTPVRNTIGLVAIAENLAAYNAGEPMPNIFTYTFWNTFCTIGGCGNTIGLIIAIFLFSKRSDYKAIAKLSALPAVFGINEPMIFGIPIVLNPMLGIPFILAPIVTATIGYFATYVGLARAAMITVPFTVPPLLNAFLTTSGSIGTVITQLICIAVSTLIYIPFVIALNAQENTSETAE